MTSPQYKILFVIRQGTVGGGESHLIDLIDFINKKKYEPIVLSFSGGAMIDYFQKQGVSAHVIDSQRPFDLSVRESVINFLSDTKPDLIHIHGTRAFSNLYFANLDRNIPLVYTVHGWSFNSNQSWFRKAVAVHAERLFTKRSNEVINVSYKNQETGVENIKGFKSEVIHNGVNLTIFDKNKIYPSIRSELNIPANAFLIGFIARLTEQKEPLGLLHAFHSYQKMNANAYLLMVGDGELKSDCISLAQELSLNDRVIFQPFRKDVAAILSAIDVFCLPSLWEGFSIGLLEAMAMGKAIIATGVDGTLEIIRDGINGLLIKPTDKQDLIEKLNFLYLNIPLRTNLEANAYKTITADFSAKKVAERVEIIYSKLLEQSNER